VCPPVACPTASPPLRSVQLACSIRSPTTARWRCRDAVALPAARVVVRARVAGAQVQLFVVQSAPEGQNRALRGCIVGAAHTASLLTSALRSNG